MSEKLVYYEIVKEAFQLEELKEDDLKFLELSGRKTFYSQGYYGQGITVAVIDTGVNDHEEFEDRLLDGVNLNMNYGQSIREKRKGKYDDDSHGTRCAGSIGGKNVGIAPQCKILPIKVLDGSGGCSNLNWITQGIRHAINEKVDIISMSLSVPKRAFKTDWELVDLQNAIKDAINNNILVVCAAGNTGNGELYRYPATMDEPTVVGAVDVEKNKAYFSSYGNYVDVCQVGVDVVSACNKGGYITMSGTSMSTPIVAGISALIACKYKEQYGERITERKLYEALKIFSKDLGIKGIDKYFGAGFVSLQPLDVKLEMDLNNNKVWLNGNEIEVNSDAFIKQNGRNYLSLRRLGDILSVSVSYDEKTGIATLKS